jgi:hypothetical protein
MRNAKKECDNGLRINGEFIDAADNGPDFLQKTVTGDKSKYFLYISENNGQSSM